MEPSDPSPDLQERDRGNRTLVSHRGRLLGSGHKHRERKESQVELARQTAVSHLPGLAGELRGAVQGRLVGEEPGFSGSGRAVLLLLLLLLAFCYVLPGQSAERVSSKGLTLCHSPLLVVARLPPEGI